MIMSLVGLCGLCRNGFRGWMRCVAWLGLGMAGQLARAVRAWWVRWPVVMALTRLCTVQANRHSALALGLPRTDSWRKRMLCLRWPWGVSARCGRAAGRR